MNTDSNEHSQDIKNFVSEDDIKSNPRGPVIFGLLLIFIAFGGFGIWAAKAPLDSAVSASGSVVVESERKIIQHLEGGIIEGIHVSDGDYNRERGVFY